MAEPVASAWRERNTVSLRIGAGDRDFVHNQPLDPMGDHRWDLELGVRHLLRSVSSLAAVDLAPQRSFIAT